MGSQLLSNLVTNLISLALSVLTSIWMTPFIVRRLGAEAFGYIPLTNNLVSFLTVLTIVLSSVIGRFVLVSVKQGSYEDAQGYINTFFYSSLVFSGILCIPLTLATIFIDRIINVPKYLLFDVRMSLIISGLLLLISFINSLFATAPFSANRLDISNGINVIGVIIRTIVIITFLTLLLPRIWYVSLASLISGLATLLIGIYFFRKLMPWAKLNKTFFHRKKLYELLASGSWSAINHLGVVLFLQVDLIVANLVIGSEAAGRYAAVMQFPTLIRAIAGNVAAVFAPVIITLYAQKNMKKLVAYSNRAVKLNGLILALPLGLLCVMSEALLRVWLGPQFENLKWLLVLMSFHLIINLFVMPLFHIPTAVNKLRTPALMTLTLGVVNLVLAFLLSGPFKMGLYGIALAGAISLTIKNFIFTPIYSAYITKQPPYIYYKGVLGPVLSTTIIIITGLAIQWFLPITNWLILVTDSMIISFIYCILVFQFLINKEEKQRVRDIFNSFKYQINKN